MIKTFAVSQKEFKLERYPVMENNSLQAFDAADEYILDHINKTSTDKVLSILVFNDNYGAISCGLNKHKLTVVTDSILSKKAIEKNLNLNNLNHDNIEILSPLENIKNSYDFVIVKIPKTLSYLEYILQKIDELKDEIPVISCAMTRHINRSTIDLFENYFFDVKTSLAKKKARLIFSKTGQKKIQNKTIFPIKYKTEEFSYPLINYANLFSGKKLDIGSRFFLDNFPSTKNVENIVDLGCGNGILAIHAATVFPNATITCTDISYLAIASAKDSMAINDLTSNEKYKFHVGDGLKNFKPNSVDIIICNPPFHQEYTISTEIALSMFADSKKVLKKNGELWIVANQHLGYHAILKKIFENVTITASNKKFVIIKASKKNSYLLC